jgi:N-acetyltransferase
MELSATILANEHVRLEPFAERHRDGLIAAAHSDVSIFRHMPIPVAAEGYSAWFDRLLAQQAEGSWLPHAVIALAPSGRPAPPSRERQEARIVGQSCYINPRPALACVEIGGTWYARAAQATAINPAAKLLLLGHAFACGAERVELKTDALNMQSRAAMEKLGCTFEGVMRNQMRRPDGTWRDNAWYSVVREDWPALKARIEARLEALAA